MVEGAQVQCHAMAIADKMEQLSKSDLPSCFLRLLCDLQLDAFCFYSLEMALDTAGRSGGGVASRDGRG